VTAGFAVAVVALLKSVATVLAPASVHRSAVPWNCIVSPVMPAPGGEPVSTRMYALSREPLPAPSPSRPARLASGRMATRFPPDPTQPVKAAACAPLTAP